jgi:hypothetical protein
MIATVVVSDPPPRRVPAKISFGQCLVRTPLVVCEVKMSRLEARNRPVKKLPNKWQARHTQATKTNPLNAGLCLIGRSSGQNSGHYPLICAGLKMLDPLRGATHLPQG